MFIRWLFTVFPVEMQAGWRLVRRDLVLWIALAGLLALASAGAPTEGDPGLNFATFIGVSTALLTAVLPAILFEAAARDVEVEWGDVAALLGRKLLPFVAYATLAFGLTAAAAVGVQAGMALVLRGTPLMLPLSTAAAAIVSVTLLVRFCFMPFLVLLHERDEWPAPDGAFGQPLMQLLSWPLVTSSAIGADVRWRLVPYVVIIRLGPLLALAVPPGALLPFLLLWRLFELTALGVLFQYFIGARRRFGLAEAEES